MNGIAATGVRIGEADIRSFVESWRFSIHSGLSASAPNFRRCIRDRGLHCSHQNSVLVKLAEARGDAFFSWFAKRKDAQQPTFANH
jgi:hypothetical protein